MIRQILTNEQYGLNRVLVMITSMYLAAIFNVHHLVFGLFLMIVGLKIMQDARTSDKQ